MKKKEEFTGNMEKSSELRQEHGEDPKIFTASGVKNESDHRTAADNSAAEPAENVNTMPDSAAPEGEIAGEETSKSFTPEEKIAELEAKLEEANGNYLRKAADFENFRKRMNREKLEITEFANQNLLLDILPVIDDFERAIKSAETSKDFPSFHEGITLIEKRLSTQLENKWGLKRFDSEGEHFDPNRHEAVQMEKSKDVTEAVVKEDHIKGYMLKDRVLRFAKVTVLMPEVT